MFRFVLTGLIFFAPIISHAAITINEVAWMGTAESANDEWIELHNSGGSSVSVDGWVLSDGMNLSIELTGSVAAGEYAVLERTDDSSAPGIAFLIYTGALTNTGATLKLTRDDGGIEDQVAGGENWENIGGDNTTKETAQYTSGGWVTGTPTPGASNVAFASIAQEVEQVQETTTKSSNTSSSKEVQKNGSKKTSTKLELPDWTLELSLTAPTRAYVHQPVPFLLESSGLSDTLLASVQYSWNMGDLDTLEGKEVIHQYEYPGTYVVVAEGEYKRHKAQIRHEITVLPVTFSLTTNADGDVQINNDSKYEIDLSGYSVRGDETVVLPKNTILLPNATLTIPKEKLGGSPYAWLMDQAHMVVASRGVPEVQTTAVNTVRENVIVVAERKAVPPVPTQTAASQTRSSLSVSTSENQNARFQFADDVAAEELESVVTEKNETPQWQLEQAHEAGELAALVNEAQTPIDTDKLPYLGLIGVLSLGILALFATRVR